MESETTTVEPTKFSLKDVGDFQQNNSFTLAFDNRDDVDVTVAGFSIEDGQITISKYVTTADTMEKYPRVHSAYIFLFDVQGKATACLWLNFIRPTYDFPWLKELTLDADGKGPLILTIQYKIETIEVCPYLLGNK